MKTRTKGIDVSKHQGHIDWEAVRADGIEFAILRVGYGNDTVSQDDELFIENADACTRLGIPFGVYLYSYATSVEEARSEAMHVLRLIRGYDLSFPVYYDLEDEGTTGKCSNEQIEAIATNFAWLIQASLYRVGIYASKYWWTTKLTGAAYNLWERWVAQYNSECTYSGEYGMWQYGSDGRVNGITGRVDVNICYKNYPAILAGIQEGPSELENDKPDLSSYTGVSIAAALKECGCPNNYEYRKWLAAKLGIMDYRGTAEQNLDMLAMLGATVKANDKLKAGAAIRVKSGATDLNTGTAYAGYVYNNTYTVLSVKNGAVVFGVGSTATGKVSKEQVILA